MTPAQPAIRFSGQESVQHFSGDGWIKAGEWFIRQHQIRLLAKQACQSDALPLTAGQHPHWAIQPFIRQQCFLKTGLPKTGSTGLRTDPEQQIGQCPGQAMAAESTGIDVLRNAEFFNQTQVLPESADAGSLPTAESLKLLTLEKHSALRREKAAVGHCDPRTFPSPAATEKGDALTLPNPERDRVQPVPLETCQTNLIELQQCCHRILPNSRPTFSIGLY